MAHDIKEYIIKNDLKNVCLMGHSLGGKIVMKMAQLYPQLHNVVNKIAIIDILPINYNKSYHIFIILAKILLLIKLMILFIIYQKLICKTKINKN